MSCCRLILLSPLFSFPSWLQKASYHYLPVILPPFSLSFLPWPQNTSLLLPCELWSPHPSFILSLLYSMAIYGTYIIIVLSSLLHFHLILLHAHTTHHYYHCPVNCGRLMHSSSIPGLLSTMVTKHFISLSSYYPSSILTFHSSLATEHAIIIIIL